MTLVSFLHRIILKKIYLRQPLFLITLLKRVSYGNYIIIQNKNAASALMPPKNSSLFVCLVR